MKKNDIWGFISRNVISLSTVVTGFIASILWALKIVPISIVPVITLTIVTLMATSFLVEQNKKLDKLENVFKDQFNFLLNAFNGGSIKKHENPDDGYEYLSRRLRQVEHTVDQLSMANYYFKPSAQSYKKFSEIRKSLFQCKHVTYRYIAKIDSDNSNSKKIRLEQLNSWLSVDGVRCLMIGLYFLEKETIKKGFPYCSFVIFDSKEVFAFFPGEIGTPEVAYSLVHPEIATLFENYFKRIWSHSIIANREDISILISKHV